MTRISALVAVIATGACTRAPSPVVDTRPQRITAAAIEGVVTDGRGEPISGVAVMASADSGRSMAMTDGQGRYVIRHLSPGDYEVRFDPCQPESTVERVSLGEGEEARVDATLGPAEARVTTLPTPHIAGGSSESRLPAPSAGTGKSAEARRKLLADAARDADEIWIIARGGRTAPANGARRRYAAGLMCAYVPTSGKDVPLPLGKTDVTARISGHLAAVDVEQSYVNPFKEKIEAVFMFPLPESAAVGEFVMTIGSRRIRGIVRDRDEAQKIYEEARAAGYVAALLTQQRPNVFTQRVANIEPGNKIDVSLTYYHLLPYHDGAYSFIFPTVVGPRYSPPGTPGGIGAVYRGDEGRSGQPNEASYLRAGARSKRRFSMTVELDAGVTIESLDSPNFAVKTQKISPTRRRITLAGGSALPNKDYVLRYKVAGERMKSGFMVAKGKGDRYFSLVLQPPEDLADRDRAPIDMVVVVDRSASMAGEPSRTVSHALRRLLGRLERDDRVALVVAGAGHPVVEGPVSAARARGLAAHLDDTPVARQTRLGEAVRAALALPARSGRERVIALVTDGFAGNEEAILDPLRGQHSARVLAIGVGTAVNRYLMERLARLGNGAAVYLDTGDDAAADRALTSLLARLSHPVLSNIALDFGDMDIREVYPAQVPDLLVGQPVVVTGKLRGALGDKVRVSGTVQGHRVSYDLFLRPSPVAEQRGLANLWARMKIADLADRPLRDRMPTWAEELQRLARRHGMVSPATAVLGVDASAPSAPGKSRTVKVPLPLPEGVRSIEP